MKIDKNTLIALVLGALLLVFVDYKNTYNKKLMMLYKDQKTLSKKILMLEKKLGYSLKMDESNKKDSSIDVSKEMKHHWEFYK